MPVLGADTDAILAEFGVSPEKAAALKRRRERSDSDRQRPPISTASVAALDRPADPRVADPACWWITSNYVDRSILGILQESVKHEP